MAALPRALFAGLFDNAAVFPPGNAPIDTAVAQHRAYRRAKHADLIGPLLLPATSVAAAADLAGLADLDFAAPPQPPAAPADQGRLDITVIGRPDVDPQVVRRAAARAGDDPRLALRGIELAWHERWERLELEAPRVVLELPRGTEQALALTELAVAIAAQELPEVSYAAKFRTGATPTWDWPAERELSRAISASVSMDVPLKLTGGLHHAVRTHTPEQGEQHGLLNVLLAFAEARRGAGVPALTAILQDRGAEDLLSALADLSPARLERLRADFPAYGCCTVTDPIAELTRLGALDGEP